MSLVLIVRWHHEIVPVRPDILSNVGFAFALFRAKTVREFGDSYYTSTTSLSHSIYVSIHIWKMAKILKLIERFERIIQKSELKFRTILVKSKNLWERGIRVQNTGFARPWQITDNIVMLAG